MRKESQSERKLTLDTRSMCQRRSMTKIIKTIKMINSNKKTLNKKMIEEQELNIIEEEAVEVAVEAAVAIEMTTMAVTHNTKEKKEIMTEEEVTTIKAVMLQLALKKVDNNSIDKVVVHQEVEDIETNNTTEVAIEETINQITTKETINTTHNNNKIATIKKNRNFNKENNPLHPNNKPLINNQEHNRGMSSSRRGSNNLEKRRKAPRQALNNLQKHNNNLKTRKVQLVSQDSKICSLLLLTDDLLSFDSHVNQ